MELNKIKSITVLCIAICLSTAVTGFDQSPNQDHSPKSGSQSSTVFYTPSNSLSNCPEQHVREVSSIDVSPEAQSLTASGRRYSSSLSEEQHQLDSVELAPVQELLQYPSPRAVGANAVYHDHQCCRECCRDVGECCCKTVSIFCVVGIPLAILGGFIYVIELGHGHFSAT